MLARDVDHLCSEFVESVLSTLTLSAALGRAAERLGIAFGVSRALIFFSSDESPVDQSPVEWTAAEATVTLDTYIISLAEHIEDLVVQSEEILTVNHVPQHPLFSPVSRAVETIGVKSLMAQTLYSQGEPIATIVLSDCNRGRQWSIEEQKLFEKLGGYLELAINNCLKMRQVSESEGQFRTITETSPYGVITFDVHGVVTFVNNQYEQQTGHSRRELLGRHYTVMLERLVSDEDRAQVARAYRECFGLGIPAEALEYSIREAISGTSKLVVETLSPITTEGGEIEGYRSIVEEITNVSKQEKATVTKKHQGSDSRYQRLVEHADAIIFNTDPEHNITFISRRSLDFFGVSPEDFVARESICWIDLVHPEDRERVRTIARESQNTTISFDEEFRVVNHISGRIRWLLTKLVPVLNEKGILIGWDGFGIDITARREAQLALEQQSKKIRALYTVSAAISGYIDPANVSSRGLAALCDATGGEAALCYLFQDKDSRDLELVSHYGFSASFVDKVEAISTLPNLSQHVATSGHPVVVPDVRSDARASALLAEDEGIRSAVLVPVQVEDDIMGTIGLFSRELKKFDGGDVMLITAAASQIGLAARQAQLFSAYRRQTKNLSALYRMSRELSRNLTLEDIFQHAFSIIRDELGLKRLWLGLLNETGSRIVGQAAYGPGWKRRLVEMNVELTGEDNPIAKVIETKQPMTIDDSRYSLKEFGLKRIFSRLAIQSIVLVPIVSAGQVIGVLAVQPHSDQFRMDEERLTLLSSLANEIASVVLTKRLEERVSEGEKMRTAGLLAAGIAHNFNNLLQAILGQASLIDMQKEDPSAVAKASKTIVDAANKGSSLVKQLLSFAHLEHPSEESIDVNSLIERSAEALRKLLRENQELRLHLDQTIPSAYVDPKQLIRILTNIITNATEAMVTGGTIELFTDTITVNKKRPHFEVPFGDYVRVGIRDNGVGMDAETKRRCFEPFFTTKDRDPGSGVGMTGAGLGLAAAFALARRNGGRLVVDSRPGYGSLFTVYVRVDSKEKHVEYETEEDSTNLPLSELALEQVSLKEELEEQLGVFEEEDEEDEKRFKER